jgi:hypothetical protein
MPPGKLHRQWIDRFTGWAEAKDDLRAAVIVGSRGRSEAYPAEEWSDLDVLLMARRAADYLREEGWLREVAPFWAGIMDPGETWHGIFDGGMRFHRLRRGAGGRHYRLPRGADAMAGPTGRPPGAVSRAVATSAGFRQGDGAAVTELFHGGARVLLDKDGLAPRLKEAASAVPVPRVERPSRHEFQRNVDGFWLDAPGWWPA